MTSASVLGVPITAALAAGCRELLAGVASREAWVELEAAAEAAELGVTKIVRGPYGTAPVPSITLRQFASCALGTACARCSAPIEDAGEELDDGWCCSACAFRERQLEAFRRRASAWLRRGNQMGLFGVEPAKARKRRR